MRKGADDEINLGYITGAQEICNKVKQVALLQDIAH